MQPDLDVALARALLKRGWASKEVLEDALGAVGRLRLQEPETTLYDYLYRRGIVCQDRLNAARESVALQTMASAAPPAAAPAPCRPSAARRPNAADRLAPSPPPNATARPSVLRSGVPAAQRPRSVALYVVTGAVGAAALLAFVFVLLGNRNAAPAGDSPVAKAPSTEAGFLDEIRASAGTPARQLALASSYLKRYRAGAQRREVKKIVDELEKIAQTEWTALEKEQAAYVEKRKFKAYREACGALAAKWNGTDAARAAEDMRLQTETAWRAAADESLTSIQVLRDEGRTQEALAKARLAQAWWPEDALPQLEAEIASIFARRSAPEVAAAEPLQYGEPIPILRKATARASRPAKAGAPAKLEQDYKRFIGSVGQKT